MDEKHKQEGEKSLRKIIAYLPNLTYDQSVELHEKPQESGWNHSSRWWILLFLIGNYRHHNDKE